MTQNSYNIVKELTGNQPLLNLDPVLITDIKSFCKPIRAIDKPYLLVYGYTNRIIAPKEVKAIQAYAKENNLVTVSVGVHQYWTDIQLNAAPFELLSYFKYASCVVTDTFHGTIFSVKFNRPFCSLVRESNKNKLADLLGRLNLEKQIVTDANEIKKKIDTKINYESVNCLLDAEREKSILYLSEELK